MYCSKTDVQMAFGKINADKWADVDNNGLQTMIDARYNWAIEQATNELDGRLADSPYQFPLAVPVDPAQYPPILRRMAAFLAGVLMYESRGITDMGPEGQPIHHLSWHRKWVYTCIQDIYARRLDIPGAVLRTDAVVISECPEFIKFADPATL